MNKNLLLVLELLVLGGVWILLDHVGWPFRITVALLAFGFLWYMAETDEKAKAKRKKKYGNSNVLYVLFMFFKNKLMGKDGSV